RAEGAVDRLATIPGTLPPLTDPPPGCRFAPRCPLADKRCHTEAPPLRPLAPDHLAACWRAPIEAAA
ncbi:MAG: oligopeptide/dipeptide ABC transporter ATP-binding protein, partial [Pseudomonadota bacterium]